MFILPTMHKLKSYRELAGLTQGQLGKAVGLRQTAVSNYENEPRIPSLQLCRAFVKVINDKGVSCVVDDVFPECPDEVDAA